MIAHFIIEWNRKNKVFENFCFADVKNRQTNCTLALFTLIYAKYWTQKWQVQDNSIYYSYRTVSSTFARITYEPSEMTVTDCTRCSYSLYISNYYWMRYTLFWRRQAVQENLQVFDFEDGTDRLSRNVGKELPLTTVWKLGAGDYKMVSWFIGAYQHPEGTDWPGRNVFPRARPGLHKS